MAELVTTYASLRLQVVDACIVALVERLACARSRRWTGEIFCLVAHRHLPKGERLTLLPAG